MDSNWTGQCSKKGTHKVSTILVKEHKSSSSTLRTPTQTDGRKPLRNGSATGLKSKRSCQKILKGRCTEPSMVTVVISDTLRLVGSPVKSQRKVAERISGLIERRDSIGLCVPR